MVWDSRETIMWICEYVWKNKDEIYVPTINFYNHKERMVDKIEGFSSL